MSNFYMVNFPYFLLLLISSFRALWSQNIFGIISVSWICRDFVSWPNVWSVLENISYVVENLYFEYAWEPMYFMPLFCCCLIEYFAYVHLVYSVVQLHGFIIDSLSIWYIHCWEWDFKFSQLLLNYCLFLLFSCVYFLLYIFRWSKIA